MVCIINNRLPPSSDLAPGRAFPPDHDADGSRESEALRVDSDEVAMNVVFFSILFISGLRVRIFRSGSSGSECRILKKKNV